MILCIRVLHGPRQSFIHALVLAALASMVDQDGVDPSDALQPVHTRKSAVFYFSFMELGQQALQCEQAWFLLAFARQTPLNGAVDGIVQLACLAARELATRFESGVGVEWRGGGVSQIFAKIGLMVADEPALKEMVGCKGHAGLKPCCLCVNCVSHTMPGDLPGVWTTEPWAVSILQPDFGRYECRVYNLRSALAPRVRAHGRCD